ncbi:MAG: ORF6N domain-containing protein [Usitatibacter sp.]
MAKLGPAPKLQRHVETIAHAIIVLRGQKVLLDAELAVLYGTTTKRLNEQVKRNAARFPDDFMFRLTRDEAEVLNRSQIATGSQKHRDPRFPPFAFTEHGALMAANLLNSPRAIEVSLYVVRAFVRLREILTQHKELVAKLEDLEKQTEALALKHDTLASSTRMQLRQVFEAIRELMSSPEPKGKRSIGFVTEETKRRN